MAGAGLTVAQLVAAVAHRSGERLTANIVGSPARVIRGVAPLESADPGQLTFLANSRYRAAATVSGAGALVLSAVERARIFPTPPTDKKTLIECETPYAWFALAAQELTGPDAVHAGVAPSAVVEPGARIDPSAHVGPGATIETGAAVGPRARIGAATFIGRGTVIGADSKLYPGVHVLADCVLGERCIVHSGAVIGADGFGFAPLDGRWIKIPQSGRVVIGDDVEIGANTTIDRGAMGDTVIEDGCKLDNQIQVAHNCRIGAHTVIAGCVGIAGSATIGRGCQLGGAAMIAGHISIADGCVIGGGTLVSRSISEAGCYGGSFPLMKHRDWERNAALLRHLDDLRNRIRALERQLPRKEPP